MAAGEPLYGRRAYLIPPGPIARCDTAAGSLLSCREVDRLAQEGKVGVGPAAQT